jgi:hypothetical protein
MRFLHAVFPVVILALASGTALARVQEGGGGHAGGFAGHAASGQMSGGHAGRGRPGFSGGHFASGHAGGQFIAHRFHDGFNAGPRFGVVVGSPLFVDPYYYPPVYAPARAYGYFCASAGAYYPSVPYCPEGWQQVAPGFAPY